MELCAGTRDAVDGLRKGPTPSKSGLCNLEDSEGVMTNDGERRDAIPAMLRIG